MLSAVIPSAAISIAKPIIIVIISLIYLTFLPVPMPQTLIKVGKYGVVTYLY